MTGRKFHHEVGACRGDSQHNPQPTLEPPHSVSVWSRETPKSARNWHFNPAQIPNMKFAFERLVLSSAATFQTAPRQIVDEKDSVVCMNWHHLQGLEWSAGHAPIVHASGHMTCM